MKRIVVLAFLILLATSTSIMAVELADVNGSKPDVPSFVGYAPNRIVVNFDSSTLRGLDKAAMARGRTGIPALDHVGSRHGVMSLRPQFPGAKKKTFKGKVIDLTGWHKVKFSRSVDVLAVVEEYKAMPGVVDAQPVGIHRVSQTPNDPWYLQPGYQWHLPQIWAEEAWDIATGNSNPPIIVAVLDTGIRYFHKDLGGPDASLDNPTAADGNMWINLAEKNGIEGVDDDGVTASGIGYVDDWIGWDFVDDPCANPIAYCYPCCCADGEDCLVPDNDPRDFHGHGTHCAGNVSAINNNEYSTASPAGGWGSWWTPPFANGVKVMSLRIGWDAVYVLFEAGMVAMDYAAEALYYAGSNGAKIASCSWGAEDSGGIGAAIDYFVANGGLIFKAAGNDSTETADFMCARDDVICVAATDQGDCKASFSTYGPWVDVSAPGVQIGSLYHWKGDPANDYVAPFDGTSMATPLAASVAALIWSQDTSLSADDVKTILFASADPIDSLLCNSSFAGKLGAGRINAFQAVLAVGPPPAPVADFSGSPTTGDAPLTVNFSDSSTGSVDSWSWTFGDGGTSTAQNPSHTYAAAGTYAVALTVTGPGGADTNTKTNYITAEPPPPPPIPDFSGSPTSGPEPLIVIFTDMSTGTITTWNWNFGDGGTSTGQYPWHEYTTAGSYTVSLTVSGPDGSDTNTKTNYITVTTSAPGAQFTGTPLSGTEPLTVDFTDSSTGSITSRSWTFGDGGTSTAQNPSHTYAAAGTYTVALTVTGPGGADTNTKTNYITVTTASLPNVGISGPLATGRYGTFGRGRDKYTEFVETDMFSQGDDVIIRATVTDSGGTISGAIVEIAISGPEAASILSGPSDSNGIAEAKWKTSAPKGKGGGTTLGTYTATVNGVMADGHTWDGNPTYTTITIQ